MRHWPPYAPPLMSYNSTNLPPSRRQKLPVRPLLWPPLHAGTDRRHYPRLAGGLSRLRYQTLYHFRALLRSTCGYQSEPEPGRTWPITSKNGLKIMNFNKSCLYTALSFAFAHSAFAGQESENMTVWSSPVSAATTTVLGQKRYNSWINRTWRRR